MKSLRFVLPVFFFLSLSASVATAQDGYRTPPQALVDLVDAAPTPSVSISPDGTRYVLSTPRSVPTIADLAEPELRLAGSRINPANNGPSRSSYVTDLRISPLEGEGQVPVLGVPDGARISGLSWSPDGAHFAFSVVGTDRIDLYVADAATGQARQITDRALNAVASFRPYTWMPSGDALLVLAVDADRGAMPPRPSVPAGPVIQENLGDSAPARTYQDLLEDPYQENLYEWLRRVEVLYVPLDGMARPFGPEGMVSSVSPSPDGRFVLVSTTHRPFSYIVPASRFPERIEVWSASGELVKVIDDQPLMENVPTGFGSVPTGKRSLSWRQDADATLYWAEALDGGDASAEVEFRDVVRQWSAPFAGEPVDIMRLPLRYGGVSWSDDGFALVSESWWATRTRRTYKVNPDNPSAGVQTIFDYSYEDRYNDPGSPMGDSDERGRYLLVTADGGESIYLSGIGASPEGNRPFIRKMNLETGATEELFRSEAPYYERPAGWIDAEKGTLLTLRESASEPPNYFVRDLESGRSTAITQFQHPYPQMDAVQKEFLTYQREDGVQLTATLYLPPDYDPAADGPLPTLVWAYPREFKSADAASQVTTSPYTFKRISYSGAIPYVTQGYAIIDDASMPIVGEGDDEPNDSFVEQLRLSAEAVIEEGVRRGVVDPERVAIAGHSYGAFMTANLLAHTDLFRAGIARSGAYNRTLTPFGFQAEERTFWEAPEVYFAMSPFMHADKVNEPILMIHGMADNNSGTFPIQSERFYAALKGHGATARLVMLPHESHGYQARESVLHMLWETNAWLDKYVRNAPPRVTVGAPTGR